MTGEIYCFDFTISKQANHGLTVDSIKAFLTKYGKKWGFQKEIGEETKYEHFQGRISLRTKKSVSCFWKLLTDNGIGIATGAISPTFTKNSKGDEFYTYITKDDTRVEGPWTNRDEIIYVPRQIRAMNDMLRPFQQSIIDDYEVWNTRTINLVWQTEGNIGKSLLVGYCRAHRIGRALPPVNDQKDLLRMVCDLPTSKMYLFDMPKSMNKERLYQFYSAVETIKDGYAYDDRYNFKEKVFDCPNIWIFSNTLPKLDMLSMDRWKIWTIDRENYTLEGYLGECA